MALLFWSVTKVLVGWRVIMATLASKMDFSKAPNLQSAATEVPSDKSTQAGFSMTDARKKGSTRHSECGNVPTTSNDSSRSDCNRTGDQRAHGQQAAECPLPEGSCLVTRNKRKGMLLAISRFV